MVRLKACRDFRQWLEDVGFQFHYGTIKRFELPTRNIEFECFNSTMVRLKVMMTLRKQTLQKFQFHYGTIKSNDAFDVASRYMSFNSTMVRLKALHKELDRLMRTSFNSTMVRLKV